MELFIWESFKTVAEIGLKEILGKSFDRLFKYKEKNDMENFKATLEIIIESNENIKQDLENLKNGTYITQSHAGTGDNIGGNKTINNYNQYKNNFDFKKHPLYQSSLFLDDIELNYEPLNDEYYQSVLSLLNIITDESYKDAVKKLLPNETNRLLQAYEVDIDVDRLRVDREMIVNNKENIKKLLLQYLENPQPK